MAQRVTSAVPLRQEPWPAGDVGSSGSPSGREAGPTLAAGGLLTIDLGALTANWRRLRDLAAPAECAAVVKADAYGIGLEPAMQALAQAGCRTFFVAHLAEGLRARAVDAEATIYVLNGLLPGTSDAYAGAGLRPVLGSREEVEEWAAFCRAGNQGRPAAIHVDTGMNRLGLPPAEALTLAGDPLLAAFEPALIMSHLVSAEVPEHPLNARQTSAFDAVRSAFPGVRASLANSSGVFLPSRPYYDLVRPGYALYGGNPTPGRANPMADVVRLEGRVLQVRGVVSGETAGYNARWTACGPRRLATASVGYADGYRRAAGGSGPEAKQGADAVERRETAEAIVAGRRCPVVGTISMDLIILDVTEVPRDAVHRGDLVTLIGDGLTLDEVGRRAGTIGYEILTSLGRRYAHCYTGP